MKTDKLREARATALALMRRWGLLEAGWSFDFNSSMKLTGLCVFPNPEFNFRGRIELSRHMVRLNPPEEVRDTILHEIAHALAGRCGGDVHGPVWAEKCLLVGARPQAMTPTAVMPQGRFVGTCRSCSLTTRRWSQPSPKKSYACLCGGVFSFI